MAQVDELMGSVLIGVCLACILYGITTLQTFMYVQTYADDPLFLRAMVFLVWIIETVHTAFCIQFIYVYLILHFGDVEFLAKIYWNAGPIILTGVLIQLVVHSFYVRRVWILSNRSRFIVVPLVVLVGTRLGFGIGGNTVCFLYPAWTEFMERTGALVVVSTGIGTSACIDVVVATILIYYLTKGRGRWTSSDGVLTSLIVYIVNTGALTSFCSILTVIMFSVKKDSLIFLALIEIQSKLYANAFLGSLNTRQHIRNRLSGNTQNHPMDLSVRSQFIAPPPSRIEVLQETIVTDDAVGEFDTPSERIARKVHIDLV